MNAGTVLISGAGIAGSTLAFWLRAAGFESTLIEHARELRTGGYVIDIWEARLRHRRTHGSPQPAERSTPSPTKPRSSPAPCALTRNR
jgi:2-polyprenyl-6-methoxyphenol hydroxylase-like FAD-dependent oxidoreductase